ncbi:MAG: caspase family protein [Verrucomicrobiota bacterium]
MLRLLTAALLLFASFSLGREPAAPVTRTALVIGNAKYEPTAGPLRNTVNDARAVAAVLKSLGFSVELAENVTRDELLKALLKFRATVAGKEVALFYFAGHGITVAGSNYLLPIKSGYQPEGADDVTLRLMAETRLFNVEQAVADLKSGGAQCNLVILDACRTTALARTGRTRDASGTPGGLTEMKPPAGSLIAFATDAGQTALDGAGTNGLYTEELLRHMRTPGLTIEQVFTRTRAAGLERSSGQQIPAEYSRLVGEDVYLAGAAVAEPTMPSLKPAPAPVPVKAEPVVSPRLGEEMLKLAKQRRDAECIEAMKLLGQAKGMGVSDQIVEGFQILLDRVKDALKKPELKDSDAKAALQTCDGVIAALPECLPATHPKSNEFLAKAHNRRGDALLVLGLADEALEAFNAAQPLAPDDAYVLYNRARAHIALGDADNARVDLQAAIDPKFRQPVARELAETMLREMK